MRNELVFYLTAIVLSAWSCDQPTSSSNNNNQQLKASPVTDANQKRSPDSISPDNLFNLADAENILGEPAHLSDSSTTASADAVTYRCAYTANSKDKESEKTGVIYFLLENYSRIELAQTKYTFTKTANEDHGITVLDDLGDEAYFHTDKTNFYFIMVRKGKRVFNMKVNKITSTTSLEMFNLVAKKITENL